MFLILFIILMIVIYNRGSERTKTVMKYMFGYWIYDFIRKHKNIFR